MADPPRAAHLVDNDRAMRDMIEQIRAAPRLALDTESNSLHAYHERLCLIQVASAGASWIVDPLARVDLRPLFAVLADDRVTKILHDAEFDLLQLSRAHGARIRGLFDTKIAAVACHEPGLGLAALCARYFDVTLDKSQQRSDWSKRPLTPRQIEYAVADVWYLLPLAEILEAKLADLDRLTILEVKAELRRLELLEARPVERDPLAWRKLKGASKLDPRALRALNDLYHWRETHAARRDVPAFKIAGNAILLVLAQRRPKTIEELENIRAVPAGITQRWGRELIAVLQDAATKEGMRFPPEPRPRRPRRDGDEDTVVRERLKRWRKQVAEARGTDASLVLNRDVLDALARLKPRPQTRDALAASGLLEDWRLEAHGDALLAALRGDE